MQNTVKLNPEGYIEVALLGDQDSVTVQDLYLRAKPYQEQLASLGKPDLALVDVSQIGGYGAGSNKEALQTMEKVNYDRVAIFGVGPVLREVLKLITLAMGKDGNTKYFDNREDALAWLLDKDPA
jgi:hypothetical protein